MGPIERDTETLYELLNEEPVSLSSSDSSRGSHHPSRECYMTQTPEGHVESASREEATPTNNPDSRSGEERTAPPHLRMEQLRARQQEIDEAGQGLAREYVDINREIERRKDGGRARHSPHRTSKDPHRRWGLSSLCSSQPEHRRSNRLAAWPSGGHDVRGSPRSPRNSHVARACSGAAGGKFVVSTMRT